MATTLESKPLGFLDRVKAAAGVLANGEVPGQFSQEPEDKSRAELVKELQLWCRNEREFWEPVFERIKDEQRFAAGKQWPGDYIPKCDCKEAYVGDVIQQLVNRKTASLYAKNPTPQAVPKDKLLYEVWDGSMESLNGARSVLQAAQPILEQAAAMLAMGQVPPPPPPEIAIAQSIVTDFERGQAEKELLKKVGRTASLLIQQQWDAQQPEFPVSMKQLVTRVLTSRVGYVKVMYRREAEPMAPAETANLNSLNERLARLKTQLVELTSGTVDNDDPEVEQTRLLMESLQKEVAELEAPRFSDEGVVYDFLSATSVIVDRNCRCLKEFMGARRIAHQMIMEQSEAEARFGIRLYDSGAELYNEEGKPFSNHPDDSKQTEKPKVCVWHIEDKDDGLCYVLVDGVNDFIKEPYAPAPKLSRFWSILPLTFNAQEVECNDPELDATIYPRSDVRLAMPMQINTNMAGEGLREHRIANRPWWVAMGTRWLENDLAKLAAPRGAHTVLRIESLQAGEKVTDLLQAGPKQDIDLAMYSPAGDYQALMMATGIQPSNLGAQASSETATGQAIAEGSRIATDESNTSDMNWFLSTLTQMTWEMLVQEMASADVKARVGRGAVWPDVSRQEIKDELFMRIEAGSSGRPNRTLEIQNFEKLGPLIAQLLIQSGKTLEPLIREGARRLGDDLDIAEFLKPAPMPMMPQPASPAGQLPGQPGSGPPPLGQASPNIQQSPQTGGNIPPGVPPVSRNRMQQSAAA